MSIGEIPGVTIGQNFVNRRALHDAGIHRPLQHGICGTKATGAESIVLSGGYPDDEDYGDVIIYTGHGGQDEITKKQIKDQEFTRQNAALVTSENEGLPVRVVRGASHSSPYSPSHGLQYDGLYIVEDFFFAKGIEGYNMCRFRLVRLGSTSTTPVTTKTTSRPTRRIDTTVQRIIRDTALSKEIKKLYNYKCQVCGETIPTLGTDYAEAAHIKPLGQPHNGPDTKDNIICLCPNHHASFDKGGFGINDDFTLVGAIKGSLFVKSSHSISKDNLRYHRSMSGF